jgi:hypothetical protein
MKKLLIMIVVTGLLVTGGCSGARWLTYVFGGGLRDTVEAEYRIPHDSKVAVVIYTDREVEFDYPHARVTLGAKIVDALQQHLTGQDSIKTLNPRTVARYQDDNLHWDSQSRDDLAKDLGADYVLFVAVQQYALRSPGQMSLYQARFIAQAKLYNANDPEPVWESRDSFHVVHPREETYDGSQVRAIRNQAEQMLARKIALKFVDHADIPEEGEMPEGMQ